MAAKTCPNRYYERMESSSDDKLKIAKFLTDGDAVLDVGAGGGALAELLLAHFPNMRITAIDQSDTAIARLEALSEKYAGRLSVVQADFFAFEPTEQFDAVVFCSSLHEMFSYTKFEGKFFQKEVVGNALSRAAACLKQETGKIIIRDGVASTHNPRVLVRYKDSELKELAERFENEFDGFPLEIVHTPFGDVMPYNSMRELLYTVTWGKESFGREVKEWYGFFSLEDWKAEEQWLYVSSGLVLVHSEKYLQPGYKEHLQNKVENQSAPRLKMDGRIQSKPIEFPASNCLVVFSNQFGATHKRGERHGEK